jgi:hypothetical protein
MLKHNPRIISCLITLRQRKLSPIGARIFNSTHEFDPARSREIAEKLSERKHFHFGLVAGDSEIRISEIRPRRHSWKRITASEITPRALFVVQIPKVEVV